MTNILITRIRTGSRYSRIRIAFMASIVMILQMSSVTDSMAGSQLMLTPTRIVFSANERHSKVTVINSGDETGTYRIALVNKRMTRDGQFQNVTKPQTDELFADKMIRFSPRQVVLEPGKSQVVRLSLRKPSGLKPGEYRSHMVFNAIPKQSGTDIASATQSKNISIKLTPIVSISIPVIIRQGKTSATIKFTSAKLQPASKQDNKLQLFLEMQRQGNQSIYGDLLAEFISKDGTNKVISQVNGVAVYTPNKTRSIAIPVNMSDLSRLSSGTIKITYRSPAQEGSKTLAQTELSVP